jgi:signal transduction histidine kinase
MSGKGAYVSKGLEEAISVRCSEGRRRFLARAMPVYAESGSVRAATVVLQDVTRLCRFDELKNDLVATVAHEFRTPLTSLRMAIHLCLEEVAGPVTPKQGELLGAAREDCERLQAIVDELLDLSRIQAGRIELKRAEVVVGELVKAVLAAHHAAAGDLELHLQSEVLPDVGALSADAERLHIALGNLLANAIRHSPAGGTIVVRVARRGDELRFEVEDSGPGIAPEYREAVFEKHFRVPGEEAAGTGLGLFIAKEIVEAHGGRIGVESVAGGGSRFWFTIPGVERG